MDRHAQPFELSLRGRRAVGRVRRKQPLLGLDQVDLGRGRIDGPEVAPQRVERDLGHRAGELDSCGTAAGDDEHQPGAPELGVGLPLGGLERDEDPPPDLGRIVDRLQPGRERRPVVAPEIAVAGARGDDEGVVGHGRAVRERDVARVRGDADRLAQQHPGVRVAPEDRSQRLRDVTRRERARRDLIEQWLEDVVVAAVEHRDLDAVVATQRASGIEPAETTADDDHAMASGSRRDHWRQRADGLRRRLNVDGGRHEVGRRERRGHAPILDASARAGHCDPVDQGTLTTSPASGPASSPRASMTIV